MTEQVIILDFHSSSVHIYNLDEDIELDEEYLNELGFDADSVILMYGFEIPVVKHKEKLKPKKNV